MPHPSHSIHHHNSHLTPQAIAKECHISLAGQFPIKTRIADYVVLYVSNHKHKFLNSVFYTPASRKKTTIQLLQVPYGPSMVWQKCSSTHFVTKNPLESIFEERGHCISLETDWIPYFSLPASSTWWNRCDERRKGENMQPAKWSIFNQPRIACIANPGLVVTICPKKGTLEITCREKRDRTGAKKPNSLE